VEANGQFIEPSAWLPPGHDPGAASGEATTARQQGRWPSTFWLSSLGLSNAAAKSAAPFSCKPMQCECPAERASEKRVQSGRPGPWPGDSCDPTPFCAGSRRRSRRRGAKGRPGPRPGDSCVTSPHGVTCVGRGACERGGRAMQCDCEAERASEERMQSGRPGPWPGDSCDTTPFPCGVTAPITTA